MTGQENVPSKICPIAGLQYGENINTEWSGGGREGERRGAGKLQGHGRCGESCESPRPQPAGRLTPQPAAMLGALRPPQPRAAPALCPRSSVPAGGRAGGQGSPSAAQPGPSRPPPGLSRPPPGLLLAAPGAPRSSRRAMAGTEPCGAGGAAAQAPRRRRRAGVNAAPAPIGAGAAAPQSPRAPALLPGARNQRRTAPGEPLSR